MSDRRRSGAVRLYAILLLVAGLVVAVDQFTKHLALSRLSDGPVDVIHGVLTFRLAFNSGGAFGVLQGLPAVFVAAGIVVIVLVFVWARRLVDARWVVPLGLMLGGGLSNILDRLFRHLGGRVVDFIDFHVWPIFNVADASIVVGICLLLLMSARSGRAHDER